MPAWHSLIKAVGAHQLDRRVEELAELALVRMFSLAPSATTVPSFNSTTATPRRDSWMWWVTRITVFPACISPRTMSRY